MSYSYTTTKTYSRTNSVYVASKIAADLRGLYKYYGKPSPTSIQEYCDEMTEMLIKGYVKSVEYGFKRGDERLLSLKYEVRFDGILSDNHSGRIYARANITGASFFSYMIYNNAWFNLSESERREFEAILPIKRTYGEEPTDGAGYWSNDRSYSSDGVGTQRRIFRPY
jgi:hypothetical protein